ncbi:MAG: polysaccharide deacetylase family protein [Polyangiaceae bacterium]|nr:polysaccharide deacetylase family protein [Polyangiaceae bacterium]
MRRLARVLALSAVAVALPQASARSAPGPVALAPIAERAPSGGEPAAAPAPVPRVVDVAPAGERVALEAPVIVRFDAAVTPGAVAVELLPDVAGDARWLDDRTFSFTPKRWRQGRPQRVKVTTAGAEPVEWTFRARVPMPLAPAPGEGSRLILSFDDGPNDRRQADRLLDRLKELSIRALFFPSGRWAKTRPDWVARARDEGHRVCNHTYSHVNLTAPWMTEARITDEIARGAGDGDCKLFRPPLMGVDARVERTPACRTAPRSGGGPARHRPRSREARGGGAVPHPRERHLRGAAPDGGEAPGGGVRTFLGSGRRPERTCRPE